MSIENANYRSLAGGFFSSTPMNKNTGPVSIRFNNPGAVNGASWERSYPGYIGEVETTPGNRSTIFETPENGVAVWWELMRKYRSANAITVSQIINRYGGSGQDYTAYVAAVAASTGFGVNKEIKLYGDDDTLLKFAKSMFRVEAGKALPWTDEQILFGFKLARDHVSGTPEEAPPPATIPPIPIPPPPSAEPTFWGQILALLMLIFGPRKRPTVPPPVEFDRIMIRGMSGEDVRAAQVRLQMLGFKDLVVDGDFGEVMQKCVRQFQTRRNLDPDGEIGPLTIAEMNKADGAIVLPPLNPPSEVKFGKPPWYLEAEKWIGFHEVGNNQGIEKLIAGAKTGHLGDPWCAIGVNYDLETVGVPGTRSAMARSFENHPNFIKLKQPVVGAITTMWRISPTNGSGHVFLYDGENSTGVRGIGANEDDQIKRSYHDRSRITGYWWPKNFPLTGASGSVPVSDDTMHQPTKET
jgi:uncharacterized protein (TIGR02594 family)